MKKSGFILLILIFALTGIAMASDNELVIYSARKEHLIKDLFEKYEKEQGGQDKIYHGKGLLRAG